MSALNQLMVAAGPVFEEILEKEKRRPNIIQVTGNQMWKFLDSCSEDCRKLQVLFEQEAVYQFDVETLRRLANGFGSGCGPLG